MNKPEWYKPLSAVLGYETKPVNLKSKKGDTYTADCIPVLDLLVVGSPTERKDRETGLVTGYSYNVYDAKHDMGGFTITAPNKIDGGPASNVRFVNVSGGPLADSRSVGWFKAQKAELLTNKRG